MTQPSIGIVGAGIGGLATANALLRNGFSRVKVYDRAKSFIPTAGAGFGFSVNGQLCLSSIGINDYKTKLHPFDRIARLDKNGDLKMSTNLFKDLRNKFGFGIAGCLRADLIDILAKPLSDNLYYSHCLAFISQDAHKVQLKFENGVEEDFDIVIGADGINSKVAEMLEIDPSPPVYSGANIFYGIISNPDDCVFQHPSLKNFNHTVIQGPGTGQFIVFPVGPPDNKLLVWANTYISPSPPNYAQEWDLAKKHTQKHLEEVLSSFPKSHPIHELASYTPMDRLMHFGLYYRQHKKTWFKDRVCLIGDACHATLPYAGQGANQAIEDAIVISQCVASSYPNYIESFHGFYEKRSRRTQRIVNLGNFMDKLYHSKSSLVHWFTDLFLTSLAKGGVIYKQIEKEIVEECPVDYNQFK